MSEIAVVGSLNMDLVVRLNRWPARDETVLGRTFRTAPGGKGANQAVAAARQGLRVHMIGCVGQDSFAEQLLTSLREAEVDVGAVRRASGSSGIALIGIEPDGQSGIVVVQGANRAVSRNHIESERGRLASCAWLLLQLEIPLEANIAAAELARHLGTQVILTPSPTPNAPLPSELMDRVDILVPNRLEAEALTGERDPETAAHRLRDRGVPTVIVTLGSRGALIVDERGARRVEPFPVEVVDSTAAGDAFVGTLAAALALDASIDQAARRAAAAGALAVTVLGAQPSLPTRQQVDALLSSAEGRPPPDYPEGMAFSFQSRGGAELVVRPIFPSDATSLQATFRELSPQSIYRRFFSPRQNLTDREARQYATVDYKEQFAFVATPATDPERVVGVARYAPTDERAEAVEMAVVVIDAFQGQGIGRALFRALAEAAQASGHRWMLVETHTDNEAMVELAEHAGYPVTVERVDGLKRLWLQLQEG